MVDPIPAPALPDHIEETIQSLAQLHADHHQSKTSFQRGVEGVTSILARPQFIVVITVIIVLWVGLNLSCLSLVTLRSILHRSFGWTAQLR
jgi:uncharacterized membrane protein